MTRSLTPDGKECWGAEKRDFAIFNAFWYFADSVNQLYINSEYDDLRTPIGLQELSKTRHTGPFSFDSPSYGRRYAICYKGIKIGLVEVRASLLNEQGVDVSVEIEFSPKDVPYILIWRFLRTIASLIASTEKASNYPDQTGKGYMTEFAYADTQIRDELLNLLLDMQDEDEEGVSLFTGFEIELSGTPEYYYGRAKHELERRAKQKQAAAS